MLDIRLIRENPDLVRENIKKRQHPEYLDYVDELVKSDKKWRELLAKANQLRGERNKISLGRRSLREKSLFRYLSY